ncbi:GNAT family N-acetyltransferase [Desulfoplanes sp.]
MKRNDSVSITLPANALHIPIAVFAAKHCATNTGFSNKDTGRICLAVEEGINHALEFGYGGARETIRVDMFRTTLGLRLTIQFHGLPLEIEKLPKYDPTWASEHRDTTGISLLLIEKMMDASSFSSLPGGMQSVSMEKHLPAQMVSEQPVRIVPPQKQESTANTLRLSRPDDAEGISRLAFQSHGAVLFSEHIYYPDRVRQMILSREMTSVVIEADDTGEIMGHGALLTYAPDALVEELTFGFVAPRFRSMGCASALAEFLEKDARKRRIYAIEVFAVTNHVHSQRAILGHGYKESGILLDSSPASHSWGEKESSDRKRIGNIIFTKYLEPFCDTMLFIPDHHKDMIQRIYTHHDIAIRVGGSQKGSTEQSPESNIWTLSDLKEGWAFIGIVEYGTDTAAQVGERLQHICTQNVASIQLALPLGKPKTRSMAATFEDMGFFFAGVGPDNMGRENLVLQYINSTEVDYESVKVHSGFAHEIKEYVRTCDPRIIP